MPPSELESLLDNVALRRLRELTEDRDDAIVHVVDRDLNMLWASPAGSRAIFGRELPTFAGRRVTDFVHPDDVEGLEEAFRRARRGDSSTWTGRTYDEAGQLHDMRTVVWSIPHEGDIVFVGVSLPLDPG